MVPGKQETEKVKAKLTASYISADRSQPVLESTIGSSLRDAAEKYPDHPALISAKPDDDKKRCWTFLEMLEQSQALAHRLMANFKQGERVAVWADNIPEWVLVQMGVALAGLVLVPLNPAFRQKELQYALKHSEAAGIFYIPEYRGNDLSSWVKEAKVSAPGLRQIYSFSDWDDILQSRAGLNSLPIVSPQDTAQIQYTSGTTGEPKGALLSHRSVTNNGRFVGSGLGLQPREAFLNPLPLFHVAGCVVGVLGSLTNCATLVQPTVFDPDLVLDLCEREKVTTMGGVPTVLIAMMEQGDFATRDLSVLRTVGGGGASVPADLVRHIEKTMRVDFTVLFGQSEASCSITKTKPQDSRQNKAETVGLPLPQTEVCIRDTQTGEVLPPNQMGELCTRSYAVMKGYHNMPEETAAAIDSEGWLQTGDLATMDADGYCRIVGRIKDMIIRGGENVYPREIEEVLFSHPTVADVAVVGVPDEKWGEQIVAFVRLAANATADEDQLHDYVREQLAPFKTPKKWVFVDELPVTTSGKVQKFVLREQFLGLESATPT